MCHSPTIQESNYSQQNIENAAFLGREVISAIRSQKRRKAAVAEEDEAEEQEDEAENEADDDAEDKARKGGKKTRQEDQARTPGKNPRQEDEAEDDAEEQEGSEVGVLV